jgi:DNA primase
MEILSLLDTHLGSHQTQPRGEILYTCPFCNHHKKKLAINITNGKWHCWVCGAAGRSLFSLFKKMQAPKSALKELSRLLNTGMPVVTAEKEPTRDLVLPAEFQPLWVLQRDLEYRHAIAYVKRRGITMADIMKYQLGFCMRGEYAGRIIIPSYGADGKLNFFVGRSYDLESTFPYKNPPVSKNIVGFESLVSWDFPIVICEGPMDAMAIRRNAIPLFGSTLQSTLRDKIISAKLNEVILALDADALQQTYKIAYDLIKQGLNVYIIEMYDKDPSELGFDFMANEIRNQRDRVSFSDVIKRRVALA